MSVAEGIVEDIASCRNKIEVRKIGCVLLASILFWGIRENAAVRRRRLPLITDMPRWSVSMRACLYFSPKARPLE